MDMTTYARFPGDTRWDNDNISTSQSLLQAVIGREVTLDLCGGCDVGEICSDTWGVDDIVKAQL